MIQRTSIDGYIGCVAALQGFDVLDDLVALDIPAQFIAGAFDPAATPEIMRAMHERVEGSSFHIVPDAAHLPALERPEALGRLLSSFISSHS